MVVVCEREKVVAKQAWSWHWSLSMQVQSFEDVHVDAPQHHHLKTLLLFSLHQVIKMVLSRHAIAMDVSPAARSTNHARVLAERAPTRQDSQGKPSHQDDFASSSVSA